MLLTNFTSSVALAMRLKKPPFELLSYYSREIYYMSEAWKAGGCRAPGGRAAQFAGEFAAVRARSSRVVRASSRTLFARCVICCSRAVRALFVRCSRVVRTLFALVVRTFNFYIKLN